MSPLSYLGSGVGSKPIEMPDVASGPGGMGNVTLPPPGAMGGGMPSPSGGLPPGAIPANPSPFAMGMPGPAPMPEYATETQEDGSILIRTKNPDGSPGRAVKIVPPIKQAGQPAGVQMR